MANVKQTMEDLLTIDGAMCTALVDAESGMILGQAGSGVDLEVAAAGNTEVVRAKMKTMKALGLNDTIEDILITLGRQYHLMRPLSTNDALFIYVALDRGRANLALARHQLAIAEKDLAV